MCLCLIYFYFFIFLCNVLRYYLVRFFLHFRRPCRSVHHDSKSFLRAKLDQYLVQEEDLPGDITISEDGGVRYLHFGTRWFKGGRGFTRPDDWVLGYTKRWWAGRLCELVQGLKNGRSAV